MAKKSSKVLDIIEEVKALDVDSIQKEEAVKELEDLLGGSEDKVLLGYHPVTGEEVWN